MIQQNIKLYILEWRSQETVGYREMFDYFDGATSLDEAISLIQRNSRRYAKRQMTWFRRDLSTQWIDSPNAAKAIALIK